jgi:hypothetical protein
MSLSNPALINISRTHSRAICDEIGERLREILKPDTTEELPPRLRTLIEQLAKAEVPSAPPIAPTIEECVAELA